VEAKPKAEGKGKPAPAPKRAALPPKADEEEWEEF
jgi:hypothetical protein